MPAGRDWRDPHIRPASEPEGPRRAYPGAFSRPPPGGLLWAARPIHSRLTHRLRLSKDWPRRIAIRPYSAAPYILSSWARSEGSLASTPPRPHSAIARSPPPPPNVGGGGGWLHTNESLHHDPPPDLLPPGEEAQKHPHVVCLLAHSSRTLRCRTHSQQIETP